MSIQNNKIISKWKLTSFKTRLLLVFSLVFLLALSAGIAVHSRKDTQFVKISSPEILYTYSNAIVFFGRESCPDCQMAENILRPALKKGKLAVYYFDTDQWRGNENFDEVLDDFRVIEVPTLKECLLFWEEFHIMEFTVCRKKFSGSCFYS